MNRFFVNALVVAVSAYVLIIALLLAAMILGSVTASEVSDWALRLALVDVVLLVGALIIAGLCQVVNKK